MHVFKSTVCQLQTSTYHTAGKFARSYIWQNGFKRAIKKTLAEFKFGDCTNCKVTLSGWSLGSAAMSSIDIHCWGKYSSGRWRGNVEDPYAVAATLRNTVFGHVITSRRAGIALYIRLLCQKHVSVQPLHCGSMHSTV